VREATGILGALARLPLDLARGEQAWRAARDTYALEHLEIAAYELLARLARAAGDEATEATTRRNREEERAFVAALEERWDALSRRRRGGRSARRRDRPPGRGPGSDPR
jgi:hypothetical protein